MWRGSSSKKTKAATGEEAEGGGSRPYECHFCKNGFTTRQALGGHMNVHRRDRADRRPGRDAPAADASPAAYPPAPRPTVSVFATYYDPAGTSAAWDATNYGGTGQTGLNLFGAAATYGHDLHLGVGPRVPGEWAPPDGEAGSSLDLELRLGRHPGWQ